MPIYEDRNINNLPEISDVTDAKMVGVSGGNAGSVGAGNFEEKESLKIVEDVKYFTIESGLSSGYYINRNGGGATPLSIYSCTHFVSVEPGSFISCLFLSSENVALCFYDDCKTFISALTCVDGFKERTFDVPYNARFVRFSCKTSDIPASGIYIRTQKEYSSIKNNEIKKTFLEKKYLKVGSGLEDGKYLLPNGSVALFYAYATSSYLDVVGNEEISVFSTINDNVAICFYDENKLFISSIIGDDLENLGYSSAWSEYRTFTTPNGARYVRFSVKKNEMIEEYCCFVRSSFRCKLQVQINELDSKINNIDTYLYKKTIFYTLENGLIDGCYIEGRFGREISFASYCASSFICVKHAKYIKVGCSITTGSDDVGLCFYTKGGALISSVCGSSAESKGYLDGFGERVFEVPSNAYHVRFCAMKSKIPSYGCKFEIMAQPIGSNDEVSNTPYELLIHKVCFLGDSLTVGADYSSGYYGGNMKTNYPYYLSKMGNFEYDVKAHAGDTSKNCWDSFVKNLDCTQYDCFVIWLGTNYGLTSTLENDVMPYESYEDFADTNTGCYCKIISKIITQNPTAKIFLGGLYTTGGGATLNQSNSTIDEISKLERYSNNVVGVCWMDDYEIYNKKNQSAVLHPGGNGVHFGKIGNFVVAKYWLENIRMLMAEKLSMFEYPRIV